MVKAPEKRPIIGISTNYSEIKDQPFKNYKKIFINSGYVDVLIRAGAVPFLLPMNADAATTDILLDLVDGVLLSSGQDVHPSHYNEELHPLLGATAQQRDINEMHIARAAYAARKPILGVCRGLQLINVTFGGTLYQDLSQHHPESKLGHSFDDHIEMTLHAVELLSNTHLREIMGSSEIMTNSYHHQAIKDLAPNFQVTAKAADGVIEGIENIRGENWVMAVQWHPEVMVDTHPQMLKIFEAFVAEARKRKASS